MTFRSASSVMLPEACSSVSANRFFPAERIGVAVQLGEPDAVHGPYHLLRVGDGVVVHTDELRGNPPRNGDAGHHQNPERPEQQHETQKGAAYPLVHGGKNNHDALT